MTVANKMPPLRTNEALRAWMTRTIMNAVTDRNRGEARRRRREEVAAEVVRGAAAEPWFELCDRERLSWLSASVADLPDTDRALLQARFGEASTVAQAAGSLGLTSDAAHGRLRRALEKLRQKAAEYWHGI